MVRAGTTALAIWPNVYDGCRHGLEQCRDALDRDLTTWLLRVVDAA